MKRLIALILITITICSLLTGCVSKDEQLINYIERVEVYSKDMDEEYNRLQRLLLQYSDNAVLAEELYREVSMISKNVALASRKIDSLKAPNILEARKHHRLFSNYGQYFSLTVRNYASYYFEYSKGNLDAANIYNKKIDTYYEKMMDSYAKHRDYLLEYLYKANSVN